jgi:5-methylcytosine-specific restriction endonuclease McrA
MNKHGSKWIRPEKRERIYTRDAWSCVYCNAYLKDEVASRRTLDHIIPRSKGGSNHESNLVTCCITCNASRKDNDLPKQMFAKALLAACVPLA